MLCFFFQITFYEGKCFTGRKLEVRGDCDNFQDRGFMNRHELVNTHSFLLNAQQTDCPVVLHHHSGWGQYVG